jgi:histidinol-phosphate aminotransferase
VKQELGLEEVIKLASNESPLGPSPLALEAARQALEQAHRYPGQAEAQLQRKLASRLDPALSEQNILVGNGASDILRMISQAFLFEGGNAIMSQPTFLMYRILTTMYGGTARFVPSTADYRHNLAAMADQIDSETRLVFLCSPNNPTGEIITRQEAETFMAGLPDHVVVIFDEAYCDFVTAPDYADSLGYVKAGRNVLTVRTFSKIAGLATMRVGYAIGPRSLIEYLRHARLPFQTGAVGLKAAAASLDDAAYLSRYRQLVAEERQFLQSTLAQMGLTVLPSQANFITIVDPPLAPTLLAEKLLQQGIIVRPMAAFGLPNGVRVTLGTHQDNLKFIEALQLVLE